jgi:spermidine/putrescine transport system substrate-binding protein
VIGRSPRFSRRTFLAGLGATGLGATGLVACGTDAGSAPSFDLGGSTQLTMLNWPDYIDPTEGGEPGTLDRIRAELNVTVNYLSEYEDNYAGYELVLDNAVRIDPPAYDIVVPTNWRAAQMIQQGSAEPLPIELIPNHVNLDPAFMTNAWDRGSRFQMPWQAGITGIAYDPALTGRPLNSIEDLFDPAFAGRVGLIGEMREAVGLGMLANGDDPSNPTVVSAEAGFQRIADAVAAGQFTRATYGDFAGRLASGELVAAMAWSGDTALLRAERADIEFLIPDEGAIQWFDTMVIPQGSRNVAAAGRFMNYVYNPTNAARITAWVGYISPVLGVQDVLLSSGSDLAALAQDPVLFPDDSNRSRLFTWGGLDEADETRLDDDFNELVAPLLDAG